MEPVVVEYEGEVAKLSAWAERYGVNYGTLYCRWARGGRPPVLKKSMLAPPDPAKSRGKRRGYTLDGVFYHTEAAAAYAFFRKTGRVYGERWFSEKCLNLGKRDVTTEEMLSRHPYGGKPGASRKKKVDCSPPAKRNAAIKPIDKKFLDPGFLPHIPFGDLCHLSNTKNTGAAREGCDDTMGIYRGRPRDSMAPASTTSLPII